MMKYANFMKTLNNFVEKCPILLTLKYQETFVEVYYKNILISKSSLDDDVHVFVSRIKKYLETNYYPNLFINKQVKPDISVLENKILNHELTLSEALNYTEYKNVYFGKIVRVHHKYNEIDVLTSNNELYKYKCTIPVITLLNNLVNIENNDYLFNDDKKIYFVKKMIKRDK